MIGVSATEEILSLYRKHGWLLRCVLLTAAMRKSLSSISGKVFGNVEIFSSPIDAVWFSRSSSPVRETWELRHLSAAPFALVAFVDNDIDLANRQELLRNIELKMIDVTESKLRCSN